MSDVNVSFNADIASLSSAMQNMVNEIRRATNSMQNTMSSSMNSMTSSVRSLENTINRFNTNSMTNGILSNNTSISSSTSSMVSSTSENMGRLGEAASSLTATMATMGVAFVIAGAGKLASNFIDIASSFEQLEIRLKSVMGTAASGEEAFNWIKQFAVDTPFSVRDTTEAFMRLKNAGLDPMDGTLQKIADSAAKYTTGADGMTRVMTQLVQAWGKGKLKLEDMNVISDAGVPIMDLLGKALGKTTAEITDMSAKGIMGKDAIRALITEMGNDSVGVAASKMGSYSGAISTMGDAWDNSIAKSMKASGALDSVTSVITDLTGLIPILVETIVTLGSTVGEVFSTLLSVVSNVFGLIKDIVISVGKIFSSTFGDGSEAFGALDAFKIMIGMVNTFIIALQYTFKSFFIIIGGGFGQLVPVVIGFGEMIKETFNKIVGNVSSLISAFVNFADVAKKSLQLDFSGAKAAAKEGAKNLSDALNMDFSKSKNAIKNGLKEREDTLRGANLTMLDLQKDTSDKIANMYGTVKQIDPNSKKHKYGSTDKTNTKNVKLMEKELEQRQLQLKGVEMSKKTEFAFWSGKLAIAKKGSEDYKQILEHMSSLHMVESTDGKSGGTKSSGQSALQIAEAQLTLKKIEMIESQHREMTKLEEHKFFKDKLDSVDKNSKDYIAILKKEHGLRLSIILEDQKVIDKNLKTDIEQKRDSALNKIEIEKMEVKTSVELKKITRMQELIALKKFLDDELKIKKDYIDAESTLKGGGNSAIRDATDEKFKIEQDYLLKKAKLEKDTVLEVSSEEKKSSAGMREFADTAYKNIQTSLENFLINPFKGGLKGMLQSFEQMLAQMAAKAAAAKIMDSLSSSFVSSSSSGGFGGMFSSIIGAFGGGKEQGGYTSGGVMYQVGEGNKPEVFKSGGKQYMISGDNGQMISNKDLGGKSSGDTTHNMNITVNSASGNPDEIRRSVGQAAREAMAAFGASKRYA